MKHFLVIAYSFDELGYSLEEIEQSNFPYEIKVRKYATSGEALCAFAETPCFWSDTFEFDDYFSDKEAIDIATKRVRQFIESGEVFDYV